MERIRIERKPVKRKITADVLPLDPRDPDVLRAKRVLERQRRQARQH